MNGVKLKEMYQGYMHYSIRMFSFSVGDIIVKTKFLIFSIYASSFYTETAAIMFFWGEANGLLFSLTKTLK